MNNWMSVLENALKADNDLQRKNIGNNKRCFRTKCFLCTIILPGFRLSEEDPSLLAHPLQEDVRAAPRYGNTALWDSQVD